MNRPLRNVLVTGGAGFIGSHLVETLLLKGCQVNVLDNLSSGRMENLAAVRDRIVFHQGDIRDKDLLLDLARDVDVIFHQAAIVSVPQSVEDPVTSSLVNDLGTLLVLDAARRRGVKRVVLASSSAVYGDDPQLPKSEALPPKPQSPYALQKLTGEYQARLYYDLYGLETVCLRYFNVYGPRQDPSSPYSGVISIFMDRAVARRPTIIHGDGQQYRDFVYVGDVVRANLAAAAVPSAKCAVVNVGTGQIVTIKALWRMIADLAKAPSDFEHQPTRPGDIRESVADTRLATDVLGFQAQHAFADGLANTLQWYQASQATD